MKDRPGTMRGTEATTLPRGRRPGPTRGRRQEAGGRRQEKGIAIDATAVLQKDMRKEECGGSEGRNNGGQMSFAALLHETSDLI